jgi:hypothetical protein
MAKKKPRTPPPPRRVQAPTTRTGPSRTSSKAQKTSAVPIGEIGMRQRAILYGVALSGIVALVAVVLIIVIGGGGKGSKQVASLMAAAGCNFKTVNAYVPPGQNVHVPSLTKKFPWNTDPPSNGQHYPLWAVWGFYTEPVNPRMVVHNEEHGGVVLWWGSKVPASTVDDLQAFYNEQPDGSFGTPYAKLGKKIAITAWTGNPADYGRKKGYYGQGHLATCATWTPKVKKAFEAFRDAYRGKGPEGIPLSADEPGMGPPSQ